MSEVAIAATQLVQELRVSAYLMTLHPGVFCIYHLADSGAPDPASGLPGARLTLPPGPGAQYVTITSFRDDGWLGGFDSAVLVRVSDRPAQILMTVYRLPGTPAAPAPKLQVMRLSDSVRAVAVDPTQSGDVVTENVEPEDLIAARVGRPEEKQRGRPNSAAKGKLLPSRARNGNAR